MSNLEDNRSSPVPDQIDKAREEIVYLRRALYAANEKSMKWFTQRELDNRANAGTIAKLQAEIVRLNKELEVAKNAWE